MSRVFATNRMRVRFSHAGALVLLVGSFAGPLSDLFPAFARAGSACSATSGINAAAATRLGKRLRLRAEKQGPPGRHQQRGSNSSSPPDAGDADAHARPEGEHQKKQYARPVEPPWAVGNDRDRPLRRWGRRALVATMFARILHKRDAGQSQIAQQALRNHRTPWGEQERFPRPRIQGTAPLREQASSRVAGRAPWSAVSWLLQRNGTRR